MLVRSEKFFGLDWERSLVAVAVDPLLGEVSQLTVAFETAQARWVIRVLTTVCVMNCKHSTKVSVVM